MHILLTGSTRGIGYAIADRLLNEGYRVTGTSTGSESPFPDQSAYTHIKSDLSDTGELRATLYPLFEAETPPEVVINNAGVFREADISESSEDEWLEIWDFTQQVNLRSAALISRKAVQSWKKHNIAGRLINISSRASYRGDTQEYAAYAASKGGMTAFTKSLARSLGKYDITAYTIAPGFVHTDMAEESIEVYGKDYLTKDLALDSIAPPEQIAEMVLPLAEGKLTHATGQTFHINSGSYLI